MSAPKVRKHLAADALLGLLRSGFADIGDHRLGDIDIALTDALMSAFALFSLKSPSLLAFDKERTEGNVQQVYGTALVKASFTLVGNELDLVWEISPWPGPRATRRLVKSPQCARVKGWKFTRLRRSDTVGFIPHGGK